MPLSEVRLWTAYFRTEHERYEKIDYYLAQIAMMVDRAHSAERRRFRIQDYLLKFRRTPSEPMDVEEMKRRVMTWLKAMSAAAKRRRLRKQRTKGA